MANHSISFDQINQIDLTLRVADAVYLQVVMTRNGMVNRRGDGSGPDGAMVMGRPDSPVWDEFLAAVPPDLFEGAGRYQLPDPQGDPCELSMGVTGPALDTGFAFQYGSDSMGPPEEFIELLNLAIDLTEDWYQAKRKS
jgi:hypothetical protein